MFYGERGFHAERLCETLSFDLAKGAETEQTIKRGESLIVKRQADLLIFGSVIVPKASIKIWVINEHGGCELRPKPIVLQSGNLPEAFDHESKMQLIAVTLQEIASACEGQASIDWDLFEKRIQKMGPFIERSTKGLPGERSTEIAASYSDAMMLLYAYDRGEAWYTKASEFILAQVKSLGPDASHYRRYLLLNAYADLLRAKAQKRRLPKRKATARRIGNMPKPTTHVAMPTQKWAILSAPFRTMARRSSSSRKTRAHSSSVASPTSKRAITIAHCATSTRHSNSIQKTTLLFIIGALFTQKRATTIAPFKI
jgi:hypothetical protein